MSPDSKVPTRTKEDKKPTNAKGSTPNESHYKYKYKTDYLEDWNNHRDYTRTFDAYEAMLLGQVYDSVSGSVDASKITDSYATTLAKERADRVIAKTPEGETESVGKADVGKALFMDILRQKWIYPNANAQHSFLEKLNMWQLYSSVYGYMPMFYDWNVSNTGYVGPDCWLWNPRNLVPQQGRISIDDMDYVTALTWVGEKYLQNIADAQPGSTDTADETESETPGDEVSSTNTDGWDRDALDFLLQKAKSNQDTTKNSDNQTNVEKTRNRQLLKSGICLATRYEAGDDGEWITFAPDYGYIQVRKIKNPHKNGRIPFVIKYSQPMFDSFYGLGDFQRAKPLQFARDGLTNFYFASLKRNLSPGIIVNANGVLRHTLDVTAPNPILFETIPNSIRPMPTNAAGLSTYQGAQSNLTGSLLSLYGTQNASIPGAEALNPSQGKTPGAIDMYSDKEATRDGAERRHLETAIEKLTDGFFSLVANIGTEDVPVTLFYEDIQAILRAGFSDIQQLFEGKIKLDETESAADLKIDPSKLKDIEYRFNIDTNSTAKINKEKQLEELSNYIDNLGKFQNIFKDDPRIQVHPDKIASVFGSLADIKGADEFITVKQGPDPETQQLQQQNQELQQQIQQAQQQPSPTAVQTASGHIHESADLVRLYVATTDENLKSQIVQTLGFQPTMGPQVEAVNGQPFHDQSIAALAKEFTATPTSQGVR